MSQDNRSLTVDSAACPAGAGFASSSGLWAVVTLVAATVWLYWPAMGFDFLNWDDPWYVVNNELIRSWSPANLVRIATEPVARNFAPLTILSFLIDHTLWGLHPTGYHLTNILLHAVNGCLVFMLIRQLTGRDFVAWTTAILFLVHPVQVETVVWISSRKGLLSAAFMLASLLFWCRPERSGRDEAWGIVLLIGALLSKAIAVMLPPFVLLYDVLVRRKPFGESLVRQFVPGILSLLLLTVTMSSQTTIVGGLRDHLALSKLQLLAVDTTLLWQYVGMLLYPHDLCVLYNPPTQGIALAVTLAFGGLCCVAAGAWSLRHRQPLITLATATFFLLFLPVLNLFPLTTLMNDRYLYLPAIAFFALCGGGVARALDSTREVLGAVGARACGFALSGAVAMCLMLVTADYLPVWQNSTTLWSHAMEEVPELMVVRIQQAYTLHDQGRDLDALRVLQQALKDCPRDAVDRERIKGLYAEWMKQLAEDDINRKLSAGDTLQIRR